MVNVISETVLDMFLSDLKGIYRRYDVNCFKKIIFMNIDSFFSFVDNNRESALNDSGMTFREIIEVIEPFIPLVISDESLDTYLMTAVTQDAAELERLQRQLVQKAKIKFVKNVFGAKNEEELEDIFDVCRTIRDYKAESLVGSKR